MIFFQHLYSQQIRKLCLLVATVACYLFTGIGFFKARLAPLPGLSRIPSSVRAEDSSGKLITTVQHVIDELRPLFKPGAGKNELP